MAVATSAERATIAAASSAVRVACDMRSTTAGGEKYHGDRDLEFGPFCPVLLP